MATAANIDLPTLRGAIASLRPVCVVDTREAKRTPNPTPARDTEDSVLRRLLPGRSGVVGRDRAEINRGSGQLLYGRARPMGTLTASFARLLLSPSSHRGKSWRDRAATLPLEDRTQGCPGDVERVRSSVSGAGRVLRDAGDCRTSGGELALLGSA